MPNEQQPEKLPEGGKKAVKAQLAGVAEEVLQSVQSGRQNPEALAARAEQVVPPEKKDLTPEQKQILEKLRSAKNSEQRVRIFGTIVDDYGIDPIISAVIPEAGDAGVSVVAGLYLLSEAKKAGLGPVSYLKIIGLQAADFAIGAIPIVGDVADYFFKACKWSAGDFEKQRQKLVEQARAAGVAEEDIAKINGSAEKVTRIVSKSVSLAGKIKKGMKGVNPESDMGGQSTEV